MTTIPFEDAKHGSAQSNREAVDEIKRQLHNGEITYDEALEQIAPIVDRINKKGAQLAKKYKISHKRVTAREILR